MASRDQLTRLGLWLLLLNTANANRRHFGLTTTWLPHLVGNSVGLAMPELVGGADALLARLAPQSASVTAVRQALLDVTSKPRGWAPTMAPVTLAYVMSHPRFNIYRGAMGSWRFMGFALDSIPHSLTALSLTTLIYDGLSALRRRTPEASAIEPLVQMAYDDRVALAALVVTVLSFLYEYSEYRIHEHELALAQGDIARINMMWDAEDTARDVASNALGWLAATLIHAARTQRAAVAQRRATAPSKSTPVITGAGNVQDCL